MTTNNEPQKNGDNEYPPWIQDFGINEIWKKTKGKGVTVITLDSGFTSCPDFPNNNVKIEQISSFDNGVDNYYHGTLMASIIAGVGHDIYGIAPSCNIISIKIFNNNDVSISSDTIIQGLNKIKNLINNNELFIVNCSFDGIFPENESTIIQNTINEISSEKRVIFVAAVGNESIYKDIDIIPARLDNVISVAALSKNSNDYQRLTSSNYWEGIDLTCPGEFDSLLLQNKFKDQYISQGSSHACAFASGLIALFLSHNNSERPLINAVKLFLNDCSINKTQDTNVGNIGSFQYKIPSKDKLINYFKS